MGKEYYIVTIDNGDTKNVFKSEKGERIVFKDRKYITVGVTHEKDLPSNVTIEELLSLDRTLYNPIYDKNIPLFLSESIENIKKARKKNSSLIDCYLDEVNSSINVCEVENLISKEHADYLRKKYL